MEIISIFRVKLIRNADEPDIMGRKITLNVAEFMKSRTEWVGTATELIADMAETEATPNVVTVPFPPK